MKKKKKKIKILIVDDDESSRILLKKYLTPFGKCSLISDGAEALEAFESALNQNQPYELVCLDIGMPEMNGLTVLEKIREKENLFGIDVNSEKACVIFMITAYGDAQNFMESRSRQSDDFLVKPIKKQDLQVKMTEWGLLE